MKEKTLQFVVDHVIVICNGCHSERKFLIDPPFRSAQEFIEWHKKGTIERCSCGHPTSDFKLHLVDQN